MTSVGAGSILSKYGFNRLAVAEALILGELETYELEQVHEIVEPIVLEAARIRLEALGRLTPEQIKEIIVKKRS